MQEPTYRSNQTETPPSPPNVLFDGTRLGLEATMISGLSIAIPAGLHCGLSATLGYLSRYEEGLPATAKAFSVGSFIGITLLAVMALIMTVFFGSAIPTMLYTMIEVIFSLQWLKKRRGKDKLVNAIAGGILGFLFGIPCTALVMLLTNISLPNASTAELFRWPGILSIDSIVLVWSMLFPLINIIGGVRSGWQIGKIAETVQMYWFF
jgi:hypothetical protein